MIHFEDRGREQPISLSSVFRTIRDLIGMAYCFVVREASRGSKKKKAR
jgi:hypothetical protein